MSTIMINYAMTRLYAFVRNAGLPTLPTHPLTGVGFLDSGLRRAGGAGEAGEAGGAGGERAYYFVKKFLLVPLSPCLPISPRVNCNKPTPVSHTPHTQFGNFPRDLPVTMK
jgi:hypothetical protein